MITGLTSRLRRVGDRLYAPVAILMYHRIADPGALDPFGLCVSPRHFEEHLQVLRRLSHPTPLTALADARGRRATRKGAVVVTFDDGYADNHLVAQPLLERYEIPATVFIATGYIGSTREFWWEELHRMVLDPDGPQTTLELDLNGTTRLWNLDGPTSRRRCYDALHTLLAPLPHARRLAVLDTMAQRLLGSLPIARASHRAMSEPELLALAGSKVIQIGAHTVTHPPLTAHPPNVQHAEIAASVRHLAGLLDRPITSFSFPHGDHDAQTLDAARQAGIVRACTTEHRPAVRSDNPLALPRLSVQDWNGDEFAGHLTGWLK